VYVHKSFRIAAHITTVIHIYLAAPLFIYSLSEPNRNPQPNKKRFVLDCEIVYILLIIEKTEDVSPEKCKYLFKTLQIIIVQSLTLSFHSFSQVLLLQYTFRTVGDLPAENETAFGKCQICSLVFQLSS